MKPAVAFIGYQTGTVTTTGSGGGTYIWNVKYKGKCPTCGKS